jgi:hypothetical protein
MMKQDFSDDDVAVEAVLATRPLQKMGQEKM